MNWPPLRTRHKILNWSLAGLLIVCAGCASSYDDAGAVSSSWSAERDCFRGDVAVTRENAVSVARICSGQSAAGNPDRRGTERAAAYFNSSVAYNILADSGASTPLCESKTACHQVALSLLEKSVLNQEDFQAGTASGPFVLRRAVERAKALDGVSKAQDFEPSCGMLSDCQRLAVEILTGHDLERLAASEQASLKRPGCSGLDLLWRVNRERGSEFEFETLRSLRSVIGLCPDYSEAAAEALAELSLRKAEQLHAAFTSRISAAPVAEETLALGMSAVSSYRDAAAAAHFRLAAERGIGSIHLDLSKAEPANARGHLEAAVAAFEVAQHLSEAGAVTDHATDLEALGRSQFSLSVLQRKTGDILAETSLAAALRSLGAACGISSRYACQMALGAAYETAGRVAESQAAYRAAIASGTDAEKEEASLTLARLLEWSGNSDEALSVLNEANVAGLAGAAVLYEIGRLHFLNEDHVAAMTALSKVSGQLSGTQASEAAYMQSVGEMVLKRPGWQGRSVARADQAAQANSYSGKYLRQSCLAHILQGGKDVRTGTSLSRCPQDGSPDKSLLRGLYFLKQAQLLDVSAYDLAAQDHWRSVLRLAEESFRTGMVQIETSGSKSSRVVFDDLGREVDVLEHLKDGLDVIQRCRRELAIPENTEAWKELEDFFGHYGVLRCSGSS